MSTLRNAIRTIADAVAGSQRKKADTETARKIVAALAVVWEAAQKAWPRFRDWFRRGFSDDEWARFQELGNKLPTVTAQEREELLLLTRRGLRLHKQTSKDTEQEIPDDELDAPVAPA